MSFFITAKDDKLLGSSNRSDAMGFLAIWSERARALIPHLTEQTNHVQGFQILVEAFRLWEDYESEHTKHAGRLDDFFLLVEQAFARIVGRQDDWPLPGSRRVRARRFEEPCLSLVDPSWHLLGAQKANGLWGLYRGASQRAGLLASNFAQLSNATLQQANQHPGIVGQVKDNLFKAIYHAMEGQTVPLYIYLSKTEENEIYQCYQAPPLVHHLKTTLIEQPPITHSLAQSLLSWENEPDSWKEPWEHWKFFNNALTQLPTFRHILKPIKQCEDVLAVVESCFFWLCASKGQSIQNVFQEVFSQHENFCEELAEVRDTFFQPGDYQGTTARVRAQRLTEHLNTSSSTELARSVLYLHEQVNNERGHAPWVWEENGILFSDIDVQRPQLNQFHVRHTWRNDYYLQPLRRITQQFAELHP